MHIEWNRVTWYSWLAAFIVFGGAFAMGFWVGARWEAHKFVYTPAPVPAPGTAGAHCGGLVRNAPQCAQGFHCQLGPIADKGGTCVADAGASGGQ